MLRQTSVVIELCWEYQGQVYRQHLPKTERTKIRFHGDARLVTVYDGIDVIAKINVCEVRIVEDQNIHSA